MTGLLIYRSEDNESFETPEGRMTPIFVNCHVSMIRLNLPSGIVVPAHSHRNNIVAMVLRGKLDISEGNAKITVKEGDLFLIPGGNKVGISNPYSSDAEILSVTYPSPYSNIEELKERLRKFTHGG
ncbi:MAG: cupin domain-containing protein [Candidatus Methanomethylicaceae archaeon]